MLLFYLFFSYFVIFDVVSSQKSIGNTFFCVNVVHRCLYFENKCFILSFLVMSTSSHPGIFVPHILVPKSSLPAAPIDRSTVSDDDRRVFVVLDHLMGSKRNWAGLGGRFSPTDGSPRLPGMGSAGMAPEELRVRKFMESCTFKAMFSCVGGIFLFFFFRRFKIRV